jgi:hypothetical protein
MVFRHLSTVSKVAMLERIQSKVAPFLRRLLPTRAARRFARHQGTAPPPSSSRWSRFHFWRCYSRSWKRRWCFSPGKRWKPPSPTPAG